MREANVAQNRKVFTSEFKSKLAMEAIRGDETINDLAKKHQLHPNQISLWKSELIEGAKGIFDRKRGKKPASEQPDRDELLRTIGQLKVEVDFLKKKSPPCSVEQKKMLIDLQHPILSLRRQCELLELNRSSYYFEPAGETPLNLELMQMMDEEYTKHPFYGYRRMTVFLNGKGFEVNYKRISRLMKVMGLQAIYPGPKLSMPGGKESKKYPYLLRDLEVTQPNQVWSTDITYIRMPGGFVYLTAVIDWYSRYVLAWRLSNTLDNSFCIEVVEEALEHGKPEIFNTDQGAQYTSADFLSVLETRQIKISMDGKGRALDNVFVERLWRSVKYEEIYLKVYETVPELKRSLKIYFSFYNEVRPHQSLDYKTPGKIYRGFVDNNQEV
ncbi:MAG: IS3 family transposase [Rectinemataceae bacterium]|nr:IS3 family transposase [Rectinemataceae bacterium]